MGKSSDRGRTWRMVVKERLEPPRSFHPTPVHASTPTSLFDDDRFVQVFCNIPREGCNASDATVGVSTCWSRRMDRYRNILLLPAIQESALLCHNRLFTWRHYAYDAGTDKMEPSLSHSERGNLQGYPPSNPIHPASTHPELLLHPTNLVYLRQGRRHPGRTTIYPVGRDRR